ncbi:MAG: hypothetical protein FJW27_16300, partial [Acidimicrobiia bacterium]|nr:hypothetical protein [Acidimicrobiia bacterium]
MTTALRLVLAIGAVACSAVIVHYLVFASLSPRRFIAFLRTLQGARFGIYYGLLVIGWIAAAFFAAQGMLSWMPYGIGGVDEYGGFTPLRDTLSAVVALMSLTLISMVERAATDRVRAEDATIGNDELHRRLLEPIGYVPPAEYEARYYEHLRGPATSDAARPAAVPEGIL